MTRWQFWTLNVTSLVLGAVIIFEMYSSDQLEAAQLLARQAEIPLLQQEQIRTVAERMVQRVGQGAATDQAMRDLLARHGLKLVDRNLAQPIPAPPSPTAPPL